MHPENFALRSYPTWFARAVALLNPPQTRASLVKLFQGRATSEQIRNWRRGLCRAPQWAADMLAAEIERQAAQALHVAAQREYGPGHGGIAGAAHWRRYRQQRALEREKAPS